MAIAIFKIKAAPEIVWGCVEQRKKENYIDYGIHNLSREWLKNIL